MKIYLLERNREGAEALRSVFAEEEVEVVCDDFASFMLTHDVECVVSPANAYGLMDGGYDAAKAVFDALGLFANSCLGELDGNPKTALQHLTQAMTPPRTPVYRIVKTAGTSDKPVFTAEVAVEGVGTATGVAGSRKEAESAAAAKLLSDGK